MEAAPGLRRGAGTPTWTAQRPCFLTPPPTPGPDAFPAPGRLLGTQSCWEAHINVFLGWLISSRSLRALGKSILPPHPPSKLWNTLLSLSFLVCPNAATKPEQRDLQMSTEQDVRGGQVRREGMVHCF